MSGPSIILILGCQRSGTTVLAMSLDAHRDIELVEEDDTRFHFMCALTKRLDLKRVIENNPVVDNIVGFKSPRDSHRVKEIAALPQVKVLWISRDVYQVVASMLALLVSDGTSWAVKHARDEVTKNLYEEKYDPIIAMTFSFIRADRSTRRIPTTLLPAVKKRDCVRRSEASPICSEDLQRIDAR